MAHGRIDPDLVMTIQYAGVSEIRSMTNHEVDRTPDGSSAVDPARTHLNEILLGPKTQQEALTKMWADGVRKPAKQAEDPYVQMVLSASPSFFRSAGQGADEWDPAKLKVWKDQTMAWLKKEYGKDLAHVSLHLDEDTPHMHVLIVPTYEKKQGRKPSRRAKQGETPADFAVRLAEWEADKGTTRTAGRSSSDYWSKVWCRRDARRSYHAAVEPLGLGYGKDFVGHDEPSPTRSTTGQWVRQEAARLADERQVLAQDRVDLDRERAEVSQARIDLLVVVDELAAERRQLDQDKADFAEKVGIFDKAMRVLRRAADLIGRKLGLRLPDGLTEALDDIEQRVDALSAPEDTGPDRDGPG